MTQASDSAAATDPAMIITRTFNASRDLVWRAWTEPERIAQWWGPHDQILPVCNLDLRVGGRFLFCMRPKDGSEGETWTTGVFREIDAPKRFVTSLTFADAEGTPILPSQIGLEGDWADEMVVTVTFEDLGDRTLVTLHQVGIPSGMYTDMTRAGWLESLEKLDALLAA